MIPLNRRRIPPDILAEAYRAVMRNARVPYAWVDRGYHLWRSGRLPDECKYGKEEQAIAIDCHCRGCLEKLMLFYFDQVARTFGTEA